MTGSKSKTLMASLGSLISRSRVRGAHTMGSGSRFGVSDAAQAARSVPASSGLAARNCRNFRRLAVCLSSDIGTLPNIRHASFRGAWSVPVILAFRTGDENRLPLRWLRSRHALDNAYGIPRFQQNLRRQARREA